MSRILEFGDSPDTAAFNAINPPTRRRRRVICTECTEIYGERYSTDDGCPRYDEAENARGVLYCRNCGHGEWVHP